MHLAHTHTHTRIKKDEHTQSWCDCSMDPVDAVYSTPSSNFKRRNGMSIQASLIISGKCHLRSKYCTIMLAWSNVHIGATGSALLCSTKMINSRRIWLACGLSWLRWYNLKAHPSADAAAPVILSFLPTWSLKAWYPCHLSSSPCA